MNSNGKWLKRSHRKKRKRQRQEDIRKYIKVTDKEMKPGERVETNPTHVSVFAFSNGIRHKANQNKETLTPEKSKEQKSKQTEQIIIQTQTTEQENLNDHTHINSPSCDCNVESCDSTFSNELIDSEMISKDSMLAILNCTTQEFLAQL